MRKIGLVKRKVSVILSVLLVFVFNLSSFNLSVFAKSTSDDILSVRMPYNMSFEIVILKSAGKGFIKSDNFEIVNNSGKDIYIALNDLNYKFKDDDKFISLNSEEELQNINQEDMHDKKAIFMQMNFTDNATSSSAVVIDFEEAAQNSDEDEKPIVVFKLSGKNSKDGNSNAFINFEGSVMNGFSAKWNEEDVKVSAKFSIIDAENNEVLQKWDMLTNDDENTETTESAEITTESYIEDLTQNDENSEKTTQHSPEGGGDDNVKNDDLSEVSSETVSEEISDDVYVETETETETESSYYDDSDINNGSGGGSTNEGECESESETESEYETETESESEYETETESNENIFEGSDAEENIFETDTETTEEQTEETTEGMTEENDEETTEENAEENDEETTEENAEEMTEENAENNNFENNEGDNSDKEEPLNDEDGVIIDLSEFTDSNNEEPQDDNVEENFDDGENDDSETFEENVEFETVMSAFTLYMPNVTSSERIGNSRLLNKAHLSVRKGVVKSKVVSQNFKSRRYRIIK